MDRKRNKPSGIPGTGALVAFESAARLGSMSRAAKELGPRSPPSASGWRTSKALGEHVGIRILTYHYDRQHLPPGPAADVVMAWEANLGSEDRVVIHEESVRPLCSPGYAATHADVLSGPVSGWSGLAFLDLTRPNEGWASWEDWFEAAGRPQHVPRYIGFDSYSYVLEAAATGQGIALGWRHFIDRNLVSCPGDSCT